jgi:hypothetical protein
VRASHGLAGVMQSFRRRFDALSQHGLLVVSRFDFCQQILSANFSPSVDMFLVSRFCQQIFLVRRFTFCQQILSAYFYSQQF